MNAEKTTNPVHFVVSECMHSQISGEYCLFWRQIHNPNFSFVMSPLCTMQCRPLSMPINLFSVPVDCVLLIHFFFHVCAYIRPLGRSNSSSPPVRMVAFSRVCLLLLLILLILLHDVIRRWVLRQQRRTAFTIHLPGGAEENLLRNKTAAKRKELCNTRKTAVDRKMCEYTIHEYSRIPGDLCGSEG